jgi:hypothetical protein
LLVFVDADTQVTGTVLAAAVRAMRIGAIGGGSRARFDEPVPVYGRILAWLWLWLQKFGHFASGCFLFCTRDGFETAGRFDEGLYAAEDIALSQRLKRLGRFVILRETVVTSGRNMRSHSPFEVLRIVTGFALHGPEFFKSRHGPWYSIASSSNVWIPTNNNPFTGTMPAPGWQAIFANPVANQTLIQPPGTTLFFKGQYDFTGATVTGLNPTNPYVLPPATGTNLGGVKGNGGNLTCGTNAVQNGFNGDGSISCIPAPQTGGGGLCAVSSTLIVNSNRLNNVATITFNTSIHRKIKNRFQTSKSGDHCMVMMILNG